MAEKKTKYIQIKISEEEKNKIKEKAERRGLSISSYMRWKALS